MIRFWGLTATIFITSFFGSFAHANEPDLSRLKSTGFVMGPGNTNYAIDRSWVSEMRLMREVPIFDDIVRRIQSVVCSNDVNKSVLLVGEPNDTYRYIFARVAALASETCANQWHVEIDINKIESGHKYVGEVDQYWRGEILEPSDGKNVVLYFRNLGALIGLGSHSNDTTGIEAEYAANINAGKIRTISFINKYEYQRLLTSEHGYVLTAFQETIAIEEVDVEQMDVMARAFLRINAPNLKVNDAKLTYLFDTMKYFQPNVLEPQRTMGVLKALVRKLGSTTKREFRRTLGIESKHPYDNNAAVEHVVELPEAREIQLSFSAFDTEPTYDKLTVYEFGKETPLDVFHGALGSFRTRVYLTNKLRLKFTSDSGNNRNGYVLSEAIGQVFDEKEVSYDDIRDAIFEIVQVPAWLLKRDFTLVKNLKSKLDADVVGVEEGKRDLVRLAKIGYVAGRTDEKPIGTVLFVGPTGVGKSYIAKSLAEIMEMRLITIDMTAFTDVSTFDRFVEIMANHLVVNPYAIYLFEEIDKASFAVLDKLYFMMDEGLFYDKNQRPLFARGAFVMMTTNAGENVIVRERTNPDLRKLVNLELQKSFRASFLNRFDAMSIFYPFTEEEFAQLARVMVTKKGQILTRRFGWKLDADADTLSYISRNGRSALYGARPMERLIENVISLGIAEFHMQKKTIENGSTISIKRVLTRENAFAIEVDGIESVEYQVNPENNDGSFMMFQFDDLRNWLFGEGAIPGAFPFRQ